MAHIVIKNVGPIKEVELDLNKINVFMGPQSSGKSTIAKIICHCQWVEKQCFSNYEKQQPVFQSGTKFYDGMVEYHRLEGYFGAKSRIVYSGDYITINYNHQKQSVSIKRSSKNTFKYPKIAYIPSERNLVAAIPNLKKYNETNDVILYFMYDWFSAREALIEMSLKDVLHHQISYSYSNDRDYILDDKKKILMTNASSGVQSLTPLMMVLKNNIETIYQKERPLSYEQMVVKDEALQSFEAVRNALAHSIFGVNTEELYRRLKSLAIAKPKSQQTIINDYETFSQLINNSFKYHLSNIYLEEPEQNLFPETQGKFVYWLMKLLKDENRNHTLTITTHSPYILFSLNNCMMGGLVRENIPNDILQNIESRDAWIDPKKVSIYEIHDGTLKCIQDEDGIIEDNYLNQAYKENTSEYLSLLNYYDDEK